MPGSRIPVQEFVRYEIPRTKTAGMIPVAVMPPNAFVGVREDTGRQQLPPLVADELHRQEKFETVGVACSV